MAEIGQNFMFLQKKGTGSKEVGVGGRFQLINKNIKWWVYFKANLDDGSANRMGGDEVKAGAANNGK